VPMFLSNSPPKQDTPTISQEIPTPPERKFEVRTLPVDAPAAPARPDGAADAARNDPNRVVTVDTHALSCTDARPEDATPPAAAPVAPAPVAPAPAASKPESKPAAPPAAVEAKPAPTPSAPAQAPSGRFAVNLGVYADQTHAEALIAKVKGLGQPAYSEPTEYQGKPALRVRAGPFADRAAAESARLKIKQAEPKVPSSVVESNEQPKAEAPAAALPANRAGGWAVQLGAFKSEAEANKLRERLRGGGVASFVDRTGAGDAALWRVRAGPYADRGGAENARSSIKQKFQTDGMVVTQP